MIKQYLPNYTELFRTAPWQVRETPHYTFHYLKGSLAEREIEQIVTSQEDAYRSILAFLELADPGRRIAYYFYPNTKTKEQLTGSAWFAQSVYTDFAIHALYNEEHRVIGPHEDTHLLSLPLGLSIGFIQEGLAERMVGHDWYHRPFAETVKDARNDRHFTPSSDLLISHQAWLDTPDDLARQYYAFAALFADHLVARHGKETYLELYAALQRDATPAENDAQYRTMLGTFAEEVFGTFRNKLEQT